MAKQIHASKTLPSGEVAVVVSTESSGGGKYGSPRSLYLAVTDGTPWTHSRSHHVKQIVKRFWHYRGGSTVHSAFGREVARFVEELEQLTV